MTRITLIQPHTHGGVFHNSGAQIEVDDHSAQWLVRNGIARIASPAAPKPAEKPTPQPAPQE
jgi:hypothetical protein